MNSLSLCLFGSDEIGDFCFPQNRIYGGVNGNQKRKVRISLFLSSMLASLAPPFHIAIHSVTDNLEA